MQCECLNLEFVDGHSVCVDCGLVKDTVQYQVEPISTQKPFRPTKPSKSNNFLKLNSDSNPTMNKMSVKLNEICHQLKINSLVPIIWERFKITHRFHPNFKLLLALIYLTVKEHSIPITINEISQFGVSAQDLYKLYHNVQMELNLVIDPMHPFRYLERLCENIANERVYQRAIDILKMVTRDSLGSGKSPSSISVACVCIALESLTGKEITKLEMIHFSSIVDVGLYAVKCRYTEIHKLIKQYRKENGLEKVTKKAYSGISI
ncbi:hypothetical protein HDV04_003743 [Boothiomyces sp. JEL0838]|nr:hypothetical protein HDV04_003743 [Boothiomyces sp. JEL0838]